VAAVTDQLASARSKGLRVHYLMESPDGSWRAFLGRKTEIKWADGDTADAALASAIDKFDEPLSFME
jgi:hypothetical protein